MVKKVSKATAEKVLEIAKGLFPFDDPDMTLYPAEHECLKPGSWSIAWEGSGFDCWPLIVSSKQHDADDPFTGLGVFLEPLTLWGLGIYPEVKW